MRTERDATWRMRSIRCQRRCWRGARCTPYETLRAFDTGAPRGWGVCCTEPISEGDVVVEACGVLLGDAAFEALKDRSYVVSYEDDVIQAMRSAGAGWRLYMDARQHGNLMRLVNDETDEPKYAAPPNTPHAPPMPFCARI